MSKIEVIDVCKAYKKESVLNNINFFVNEGEIFGIVGRNGSGKTVLMKIICGITAPDTGTVKIDGKVIGKDLDFPPDTGAIIEQPTFIQFASGYKNLKYLADINKKIGRDEIYETMRKVGLDPQSKKWLVHYSLGMKQRLSIAQAIMENPKLIILDEPMNGLDLDAVKQMRDYLRELKQNGRTIVLSSHIQEDIEVLCDHVIELDRGSIVNAR